MTVRLLVKYGTYAQNDLYTGNPTDEAALLATGQADTQLTLGTAKSAQRPAVKWSDNVSLRTVNGIPELISNRMRVSVGYSPKRLLVPVKRASASSTTANGYSWHASFTVPFNVVAIKVRILNAATSTWAGVSAIVGFSDNVANIVTPSAGWSAVTFGGVSSVATPVSINAASAFGGTSSAVNTVLESDVIPTGSVTRADGVAGSVIHARLTWPTGTGSRATTGSGTSTLAGDGYFSTFQSGDFVTTNNAGFNSVTSNPGPPFELVCYTANGQVSTMLCIGDSITQGFEDTLVGGWKRRIADTLSIAGRPVAVQDWGASGSTSVGYWANGKAALIRNPPRIATFFPASPNDTDKYTAAGVARQLSNIGDFLETCYANNVLYPVLCTPTPEAAINSTQEGFRRQVVQAVKSAASASGVTLLDFDAWWNDYNSATGGWLPGYMGVANVHPNAYADTVAAANAAELISALV